MPRSEISINVYRRSQVLLGCDTLILLEGVHRLWSLKSGMLDTGVRSV